MRKPKTFKNSDSCTLYLMNQWIKFLEKESSNTCTAYPQGYLQAKILREIFDIGD